MTEPTQPDPPSKADHRKAVVAAGLMMAKLEAAAKRVMLTSLDAAIALSGAVHAAVMVQATEAVTIAKVRKVAAAKAAASFASQTGLPALTIDSSASMMVYGRRAADGLAQSFRKHTIAAHEEQQLAGEKYQSVRRSVVDVAKEKLAADIDRVAVTETADAWNDEWRRQVTHAVARGIQLVTVWNAEADACERCFELHGEEIHDDESFSEGDPPLHFRCRCRLDTRIAD